MRVLLVDDDADLREVLSDILKTRGIESVPVETGAAALARVEQQDIDVALIDLKLEDMSGLEVVRGIKARSANTECILLTGYASQATAIEAINLGAYAYFLKPYDIDQLLVSIRRAGERRAAEEALAKSEARLAGIFRVAPIAIGVVRERIIQQVNARMCEMTGYAPDELIGQSARIIYPDDAEFERVGREKYAQIHEKDTGTVETRWKHKDGRIMDILLASTSLVAGDPSAGVTFTALNITERNQAEQEHLTHLRFFEKMDKVNRAIQGTPDLEQMMNDVLETMLSIFDCDRSWLLYPCDPDAPSFRVPMEVARPEYPGAKILNVDIPMSPGEAQTMREALESDAPVTYTTGTERPIATAKQFGVQSQIFVPVYPKLGKPWVFGMHQCSYPRVWTEDERKLFQEIGRRLTDGLTSLLAYRDLRESEEMLRESQRIAGLGSYVIDFASGMWTSSNILDEIFGIDETYLHSVESLAALVHPDDRDQIPIYFSNDIAGKLAAFDKVIRIIRDNDKAERWIHGLGKVELDERGQIIRMHGTILDITERKRAEESLRMAEEKYRAIFEGAVEGIFQSTPEGRFLTVNSALARMWGYDSPGDLISSIKDIGLQVYARPERREDFRRLIQEQGDVRGFEFEALRKDGKAMWVSENARAVRDAGGMLLYYEGNIEDISERKQAEDALKKSESSLLAVLQSTADGILAVGPENEVLYTNERFVKMWRISQAVMDSKNDSVLLQYVLDQLRDPQSFVTKVQELYRSNEESFDILDFTDGRIFERLSLPLLNETGLQGRVWSFRDITGRKQAEKQLKESEKRFRALIENAAEIILVIDATGVVKFASPSLKPIMGYNSEEAVGTSFLGWVHPEDVPLALESLESRSKTPGTAPSTITVRGRHADGTWRFVEVLGTNLLGEDAIQGIVLNARDVTDRKRHERELEAEAMIAQALSETLELQPLLNKLLEAARYAIPTAEKGSLALMADNEHLQVRAISGYQESSVLGYLYPITWGYAGRVARERHPALISNVQADAGLREDARSATIGELQELCSAIAVPLLVQDTVIGVLSMESALPGAFNEDDLRLLGNFATSAALIIERAQLFETTRQRVAELEMLHESGLALNQLLTPKEIGYKIIELLKQKMDWHHIAIRLYHPQNETLELLAFSQPGLKRGVEQKEIAERFKTLIPKVGVGLSGWAVQNSQTIRSGDLGNDPHYVETYSGLHSGLYVPMKSGQRIIGVISIESEQPNAFSGADERLVVTLTNQAASALENARLFEETRQRVMELETVNRISIALRAILNPDEMLAVVLEETLSALKAAHGSINLMNDGTGKLHRSMARGWPSEFTEAPIEPGQGIFGTVFATGNFYLSRDFANDPLTRLEARGRLPSGWGGICVPIRSAQKMLGVMLVSIPTEREFNKDEIRLLNTLADMTGNALYRMKLYEETVHRAEEFESLYEMNTAISAEHELTTLIQTIVKNAVKLLDANAGCLYLRDPLGDELEVAVATHPSVLVGTRTRFGEGATGRVAQSRQSLRIEDYSTWEGRTEKYQPGQIRATLEMPIIFGGELIGVLALYEVGASERTYTETDERLLSLFAAEASGVIRSARLREETQRRLENLQALREVDRLITSSFDLQPILSTVITHTIIQLGVDAADVLLFNPVLQTLKYAAGYGFNTNGITQTASRLGEGHAGNAAFTRRTVHVSNLPETGSQFMRASLLAGENFMEYYGVPLISKGEVKGVLEVFRRSSLHSKPEWVELLETLAGQAAIAIDNTQLFESIQRSNMELALAYDATIEGWSRAMELRDEETEGHTQRVTEMAVTLARALEMTDENVLHLRRGALLHDIGKIGVPDHILLKPGKLTEQEWEIMRKHPQFAYEMLRSITYLRSSIDIPHLHHEKWDGTGYPQGLKGEQIPLAARIFAIVDVYDALTSDRPYRKAWAKARALKHIREQSGKHFDPQIVEKFLQIFGNKKN